MRPFRHCSLLLLIPIVLFSSLSLSRARSCSLLSPYHHFPPSLSLSPSLPLSLSPSLHHFLSPALSLSPPLSFSLLFCFFPLCFLAPSILFFCPPTRLPSNLVSPPPPPFGTFSLQSFESITLLFARTHHARTRTRSLALSLSLSFFLSLTQLSRTGASGCPRQA